MGIQIGVKENRLAVISPIEGTPAHRAGIKAGDFITKVNDEPTKDLTLMDAVQKMRGPKGTKVNLTIQREGTADPLAFSLVRDTIKIESVKFKVLDNTIGYVRLTQFQEATGRDLSRALKQFKEQKVQGHHPRPAEQSRRSADGGGRCVGTVCGEWKADRLYQGPRRQER